MSRPKMCRRIGRMPHSNFFKPTGVRMHQLDYSTLTIGEFEALRLNDLEELEQKDAADKMNISQSTFHRLVKIARKKVADALVNGKAIKIEGGNYKMVQGKGRGMGFGGPSNSCVCISCGYNEIKQRGIPCRSKKCPKCGAVMARGN